MINYNGELINESENAWFDNRGFLYGDAVFETVKTIGNKVLFHLVQLSEFLRHGVEVISELVEFVVGVNRNAVIQLPLAYLPRANPKGFNRSRDKGGKKKRPDNS